MVDFELVGCKRVSKLALTAVSQKAAAEAGFEA